MKKGERVICIGDETKFYTPGKIYEVLAGIHDKDLSGTLPQGWVLNSHEFNVISDTGFIQLTKMDSENTTWGLAHVI